MAGLSNYQTYALALLTSLTSLDTLLVAAETRAAAQATYLKKQMYYNMRARSCRRAAGHLARLAAAGLQVRPGCCVCGADGGGVGGSLIGVVGMMQVVVWVPSEGLLSEGPAE